MSRPRSLRLGVNGGPLTESPLLVGSQNQGSYKLSTTAVEQSYQTGEGRSSPEVWAHVKVGAVAERKLRSG